MKSLILTFVLLATTTIGVAQDRLDESKTYVVIAGVLQWPEGRLSSFPTKHRKDEELYETLKARGVPQGQMKLLLDDDATYSKIRAAIRDVASKASKDATFIFYYCGHGMPADDEEVCLANYDLDPSATKKTGLLASDVAGQIEKHFQGKRVLLLADCCYSGGLAKTAGALHKAGFEAASLTSATDSVTSTRNWTFTQTIIDGFKGDSLGDANGDGALTLVELAGDVKGAMEALENQPAGVAIEHWPKELKLASIKHMPAKSEGKFKAGEYVMAPRDGRDRVGRIRELGESECTIEFFDYADKSWVKVPTEKLQSLAGYKAARATIETATHEVEWHGTWYKASVLKRDGKKTQIHYVGYGPEWDEWVEPARIRRLPFTGQ
jgi:hypothetical protein